ncbi:MAG: hypothetical protein KDK55_02200 [Chlamydiia bacterium]|nr:hypothetical protein [Chlamydiia bacterium]
MKKIIFILCVVTCSFLGGALPDRVPDTLGPSVGLGSLPYQGFEKEPRDIVVNNRVLLKTGDRILTVMDVVKRMDLVFYRRFPELANSIPARYQFYQVNWEHMLNACIDDQLILSDAEEKKVEVTDGEIREELENLFGPDVVLNLDRMGLTFEEAWNIVKTDITVRRMNGMMVRIKAIRDVKPKAIKAAYSELVNAHSIDDNWRYRVLSVRSDNSDKCKNVTHLAIDLLEKGGITFEELPSKLEEEMGALDDAVIIKLSSTYEVAGKDLSLSHQAILQSLAIGGHSGSIVQSTKKEDEALSRIFFLEDHSKIEPISFEDAEAEIQTALTQKAIEKFQAEYVTKLRKQFYIDGSYLNRILPEGFIPFVMR